MSFHSFRRDYKAYSQPLRMLSGFRKEHRSKDLYSGSNPPRSSPSKYPKYNPSKIDIAASLDVSNT